VIGILGGAFDPPHVGHVALADAAERALGLDEIVVVVVADPGHKGTYASAEARLGLARAAFPVRSVVLDHHARTVDMLREGSWQDPVLVIGADEFLDFGNWKEPGAVLELARLAVATRPGYPLPQADSGDRVLFFEIEPVPVSSREIRERIARGEPIDGLVPRAVAAAIADEGLYRGYTDAVPDRRPD
jgi:nicotinate-nucleotide adenylyltransferase